MENSMIRFRFVVAFIALCVASGAKRSFAQTTMPSNVRAVGAIGDGKTKDTAAFQNALDQCAKSGGGEVLVPAGDYLIGSIELKSNTTLRLEKGATLLGSPDLADYPIIKARWEGQWVDAHRGLIFAAGATNIAVVGPGKIVGSPKLGGREMPRRPCVIEPINCSDILLEDFSTEQQRMWTIHPTLCQNILAHSLTIRSQTGNGDGIDLDSCRNVRVENCDIDTGDDCIALKSGRGLDAYREAKPTENVLITRCKLGDRIFACIGIGSETSGGVRNVRIEHCKFTHANTYSIYIKSHIGRGAFIENISANDLNVESATKGFLRFNLISSGRTDTNPVPGNEGVPLGSSFHFSDVKVANCGSLVDGYEISPIKPLDGLTISNLSGNSEKGIVLVNMINVALSRINVKIAHGTLLSIADVAGVGLEGAVLYHPTTRASANQ
jgi:polygalacturonase